MKQHYTVTIDQIIEKHELYTDCEGTDKYSHLRQCFIVTQEEDPQFVCGFFPMDTPNERINQAMKIIFGEKAFKEMDLIPIPMMWTPQAWPVIRDWMAQNDYSSAESIAALV
jgi:sugar/nucleoside kinase (ribokinase family)